MKRTASYTLSALACVVLAFAGCGGGGSAPGGSLPVGTLHTSALFQISVQLPATSSTAVSPKYISPNTQSMVITLVSVNGAAPSPAQPPITANITPTSPGCSTSGTTLTCSVTVPSIVGSDTYQLTAFSAINGGGSQLSSGQTTATITAGILNSVPVTLNGIIASLTVNLGTTAPSTGTASVIPVTITAKDPSGATIVGPGNYNVPVTLSDSDTSGATSLSATTISAPSQSVNLNYNGSASLASATISAAAAGIAPSAITNATMTPRSTVATIASGSGALAIYTNSAGQTFAYLPSPFGLLQVLVSSGSTLGQSAVRHTSSTGTVTLSPSPDACATDPVNVRLYCIAYGSNVVNVLDIKNVPATVLATYATDASSFLSFTGGSCKICGVAYDAADNGVLVATSTGYELYSAPPGNALVKNIAAPVSENFGYNPGKNQIFSPHYPGAGSTTGLDLVDVATSKLYTFTPNPAGLSDPDQGAVDSQTNIGVTSNEFNNTVYLLPFNLATLDSPAPGQFTEAMTTFLMPSSLSSLCSTMLDDIAVDSQAHFAFFTGEFCTPGPVGVAQLPSVSGASPTISDYNFVQVPAQPNGTGWVEAYDPHAVAAFNVPTICPDCGATFNLDRSYLLIVNLTKLLAAPRDSVDTHKVANSYDLFCNGVLTFIATDATKNGNSGCVTSTQAINAAGGTITGTTVGFTPNATYPANTSSGGTLTVGISTQQPPGVNYGGSPPIGTPMIYTTITPSTAVTWTGTSGINFNSLTVPAWVPIGKIYTAYYYDSTFGAACGSATGTLLSGTITFGPGSGGSTPTGSGCTGSGNQTVPANHVMMAVVTYR